MAVSVELLLLVALFCSNIHADIIKTKGYIHVFNWNKTADFCLVSKFSGEEKKLLWKSSEKGRTSYEMDNLRVSDSGQYQEQCWTQGHVTHQRNLTLLVCDGWTNKINRIRIVVGQPVKLTCGGAGPNQRVRWASQDWITGYRPYNLDLTPVEDETTSADSVQLVKDKTSLIVTVNRFTANIIYTCLQEKNQSCDLLTRYDLEVLTEVIVRSEGESLELHCPEPTHEWRATNPLWTRYVRSLRPNYPSLSRRDSGDYLCLDGQVTVGSYRLYVCPRPEPPAEMFFTAGEDVTLQCGATEKGLIRWFMKTDRSGGKVAFVQKNTSDWYAWFDFYDPNESLVITDASVEDSGEFTCVVENYEVCVFTSKTLVTIREPEVDHHLVRSVLLGVVIAAMMCGVAVTMVWRSRRRQHLPSPVEELQMSPVEL